MTVDKSRCETRCIHHPRGVMQSKEEEMDGVEQSGRTKLNLSEKCRQVCVERERKLEGRGFCIAGTSFATAVMRPACCSQTANVNTCSKL